MDLCLALLKLLDTLKEAQQQALFKQRNTDNLCFLELVSPGNRARLIQGAAVLKSPWLSVFIIYERNTLIDLLPLIFSQLSQPDQVNLLIEAFKQVISDKRDLEPLLSFTQSLTYNVMRDFLAGPVFPGNSNLLLHYSMHLSSLLPNLKSLNPEDKETMLKQTDSDGWNALTLIARFSPTSLSQLFPLINELDEVTAQTIIEKKCYDYQFSNVLNVIWDYHPEHITDLVPFIIKLPLEKQVKMLIDAFKNAIANRQQLQPLLSVTESLQIDLRVDVLKTVKKLKPISTEDKKRIEALLKQSQEEIKRTKQRHSSTPHAESSGPLGRLGIFHSEQQNGYTRVPTADPEAFNNRL
ncbi:hypothetical protein [Legionella impletisoli]|uniref:Uncharacterized protein n=1 Tax=Legionella impletisoli TaxID=343510 RepID=A0A917NBI1_9GAMM|nr:hypothetical protein [Legionella impletisoli]GGI84554.1 hypothetical protein GCM10007966_11420 [Legionella impletisoli]